MTTFIATGGSNRVLADSDLHELLTRALDALGPRQRVLAVPPDFTRFDSRAGLLTGVLADYFADALTDVMPALGTHDPMADWQRKRMFPSVPADLFRVHDWRNDVITVGTLPAERVGELTEGAYAAPWPAQLNRLVWDGGHDLICSIGQVVPHEVVGMANHAKNLFVGTGGKAGIDESHYVGAVYGMERMMGRADTPVRRIFDQAWAAFCQRLPVLWILTVVGPARAGEPADSHGLVTRGLYIGDDGDCFRQAAALSLEVNFTLLEEQPETVVVWLDPEEFHSTWLGNKAVYRTRMAIADGGELIVLAPGLKTFGEDPGIDALIRKHGYRPSREILARVGEGGDLAANLSAAAHLVHGSSEGRFTVRYCPGPGMGRAEIESVGYEYGDLAGYLAHYDPKSLQPGFNRVGDERIFFVPNPALGLWAWRGRFAQT